MSGYVLEAEDVTYRYEKGRPPALDGVTVRIRDGARTGIMGANGAGKSTLFMVLNALYKPQSGRVLYNGEPVSYRRRSVNRMRAEVSVLFQNPDDMLFRPYVEQDVAFGPENMKLPKEEVDRRVDEALYAVGMTDLRKSSTMRLSYGQRKRVTIAGVLAMRPKVLIMDEPTAGLDPQMSYEVMEIADQLHRNGTNVIISSHDTDLMYSWADEIHVMQHAKCVYSGEPEGFYSDKPEVYRAGLLQPKVFLMNAGLSEVRGIPPEPYPRTQSQLVAKTSPPKGRTGRLTIVPVSDGDDVAKVKAAVGALGLEDPPVGIYGGSARRVQDIASVGIDFFYNGPENCIMKCMEGKDSVLLCDPEMIDDVRSDAKGLCGVEIEVDVADVPSD